MADLALEIAATVAVAATVDAVANSDSAEVNGEGQIEDFSLSWEDLIGISLDGETSKYRFKNIPISGWEHNAVLPFHRDDANRVEYQGTPLMPISYYEWFEWLSWSGRRSDNNWIEAPSDPTNLQMMLQYGPITMWDTDKMRLAKADGVELDQAYYYDGWWMSMTTQGTSIAFASGDYVIQYMGIENPSSPDTYEQWSCVNQWEPVSGEITADVYNYKYGTRLLTNDEVEQNGDSIDYQTIYHPSYEQEGPWTMAPSTKYYKAKYDVSADKSAVLCSGMRLKADSNAAFNPRDTEPVTMRMGFRIYSDEDDQVARHAKDYDKITFNLGGASSLAVAASALIAIGAQIAF